MHKFCRIAIAVSLSISGLAAFAETKEENVNLPILAPESQHATSTKRITAQFTRAHYKQIKIDDILSEQIFDRYIKQLDYARMFFLRVTFKALNSIVMISTPLLLVAS